MLEDAMSMVERAEVIIVGKVTQAYSSENVTITGKTARKQEFWVSVTREDKAYKFKCFAWNGLIEKFQITKGEKIHLKGNIRTFLTSGGTMGFVIYTTEVKKLSTVTRKPRKYAHRDHKNPGKCSGQYYHKHSECLQCSTSNTDGVLLDCIRKTGWKKMSTDK